MVIPVSILQLRFLDYVIARESGSQIVEGSLIFNFPVILKNILRGSSSDRVYMKVENERSYNYLRPGLSCYDIIYESQLEYGNWDDHPKRENCKNVGAIISLLFIISCCGRNHSLIFFSLSVLATLVEDMEVVGVALVLEKLNESKKLLRVQ